MLTPKPLSEHKSVLRTDGNDQAKAQRKPLNENWPNGAEGGRECWFNHAGDSSL